MRYLKTLTLGAVMVAGSTLSIQASELHFIMCGGEIRDAETKPLWMPSQLQIQALPSILRLFPGAHVRTNR